MTDGGDLALLTGPDAAHLLDAAVATAGGSLVSWRARQVDHRPGESTTVSYDTAVHWAGGKARETLGASIGLRRLADCPPGVLAMSDGHRQVAVWRFPLDPELPALSAACDDAGMAGLLESFGIDPSGLRLDVKSYRPHRRAVIDARSRTGRLFVKVLRPHLVEGLHRRHRLLRDAGLPVPHSLGWSDDGMLVLQAAEGVPMRHQLSSGGGGLPTGTALLELLDQLPAEVTELRHRRSWTDNMAHYARVVGSALPSQAARAADLAARTTDALGGLSAADATHGDFYEAQLLVGRGQATGLLDLDSCGPGRRADDLACLLAHLAVLAEMKPRHRARLHLLGARWLADFEDRVDPVELRLRVAGVLMSLATGPHRVQERHWQAATRRRLSLVEQWVDSADALERGPAMRERSPTTG